MVLVASRRIRRRVLRLDESSVEGEGCGAKYHRWLPCVCVCDQVVDGIAITSFLYIGGIPHDDQEVMTFIRRNQLSQQIQRSQSTRYE